MWYLLQFKPNAYRLAERNLHRQGFETFLPLQEVTKRKATHFANDLRPLFPGYMFVAVKSEEAPWHKINSTIGVSKLISLDGRPKPISIDLMSGLMQRCDALGKLLPPKRLNKGDSVELLNGSLSNFIATVDELAAELRVWVLLEFMGQTTRINVKQAHLKFLA